VSRWASVFVVSVNYESERTVVEWVRGEVGNRGYNKRRNQVGQDKLFSQGLGPTPTAISPALHVPEGARKMTHSRTVAGAPLLGKVYHLGPDLVLCAAASQHVVSAARQNGLPDMLQSCS
jgi:hypothetical protein